MPQKQKQKKIVHCTLIDSELCVCLLCVNVCSTFCCGCKMACARTSNEKIRIMQSTLLMMIHARLCVHGRNDDQPKDETNDGQQKDETNAGNATAEAATTEAAITTDENGIVVTADSSDLNHGQTSTCKYSNCQLIKDVMRHMKTCRLGSNCTTPLCIECHKLVSHFNTCNNLDCPVCRNIRRIAWKRRENKMCKQSIEVIRHYKQCTAMNCPSCKYMHRVRIMPTTRYIGSNKPKREALLAHSCHCRDRRCKLPMCIKMRRVIGHMIVCDRKTSSSSLCREVFTFCCQHAVVCRDANCVITDSVSK